MRTQRCVRSSDVYSQWAISISYRLRDFVLLGINDEPNVSLEQSGQCVQMVLTGYKACTA